MNTRVGLPLATIVVPLGVKAQSLYKNIIYKTIQIPSVPF